MVLIATRKIDFINFFNLPIGQQCDLFLFTMQKLFSLRFSSLSQYLSIFLNSALNLALSYFPLSSKLVIYYPYSSIINLMNSSSFSSSYSSYVSTWKIYCFPSTTFESSRPNMIDFKPTLNVSFYLLISTTVLVIFRNVRPKIHGTFCLHLYLE